MQQPDWLQSIAQNLAANAIWYVMGLAYGVIMAILKKKHSAWFIPGLYGLISGVLVMTVAIAGTVNIRWPLGGPLTLAAIVLITIVAHWLIIRSERKSTVTSPEINHSECGRRINNLNGQIYRLEKNVTTAELQLSARNTDVETVKQNLWEEQQRSNKLREEIATLKAKLDDGSVPSGQIQLLEAFFFVPNRDDIPPLDARNILQSDIDNRGDGKLWLGHDELYHEHFRPDPKPGASKLLRVDYLHRGRYFSITVSENVRTVLPLSYKLIERDRDHNLTVRY